MNLDNFKPAIVYTIYIASTPEKVWRALTTAEFSRKYFSGFAVEAELKVGGGFVARAPDGSVHISGEVIECDPPKKLTITWNVNWPRLVEKLGVTLVTYEIERAGDAVRLTLTQAHDRPIDGDILSGGRQGWPATLSSLKSLLETGRTLVIIAVTKSTSRSSNSGNDTTVSENKISDSAAPTALPMARNSRPSLVVNTTVTNSRRLENEALSPISSAINSRT